MTHKLHNVIDPSLPDEFHGPANRYLLFLIIINALLLLLRWACYPDGQLNVNLASAMNFVISFQALFFAGVLVVLCCRRWSAPVYNLLLICFCFAYFFWNYGAHQSIVTLQGDNLCQIAFWKILFYPNLAGSIGASFTKPGQLVVLGVLNELNSLFGSWTFSIGMCLIMACCVFSLIVVASDIGGRIAGIIAFPVISGIFLVEFMHGSYSILLIPIHFLGLKFYFYDPKRKNLGRLLLLLSIHFHIQVVAVLAAIWFMLLIKRDWKELLVFSGGGVLSLALWVAVIVRIQGSMARLNSGAAAGYVADYNSFNAYPTGDKLGYLLEAIKGSFEDNYFYVIFLAVLALFGIVGCLYYGFRQYLQIFSILALLTVNVLLLGGGFNFERYFALLYAFAVSVGVGAIVRFVGVVMSERRHYQTILACLAVLLLVMMFDFSILTRLINSKPDVLPFVASALTLRTDKIIPDQVRLMTEDDFLYPLVVLQPERYSRLAALQYFNVANEAQRRDILNKIDYIWIAVNGEHPFYYLEYVPEKRWVMDPFRLMTLGMLKTMQPRTLYGHRFVPVNLNSERLVIKVGPE